MGSYQFCNQPTYFKQLAKLISQTKSGDRVGLATMAFNQDEPLVADILVELTKAAKRGVKAYFAVDALAFMMSDDPRRFGPVWYGKQPTVKPGLFGERFELFERLRQAGGHYAIINRPSHAFSLPVAGRSHIKTAIINDRVYIGGHNLASSNRIDLMTYWEDPKTADLLFKFLKNVIKSGSVGHILASDQRYELNSTDSLIIDCGQRHQSLILETALNLIDSAEDWLYMTCQYFPGGRTGRHLKAALDRGVKVRLVFSPPSVHGSDKWGHQIYEKLQRLKLPDELFSGKLPEGVPKLHAKLIATEQGAIIGSHNYVGQGVWLGTAEIALLKRDPAFAKAAVAAIDKEIKSYV